MLGPVVSENVVDGSKYPGSDNSVNKVIGFHRSLLSFLIMVMMSLIILMLNNAHDNK